MSREPCSKCDSSDKEHYCGHCERCNDCCPDWEAHGRMTGMAKKSFDIAWEVMKSDEKGDNAPTNPGLWSQAKSKARAKFKVYPSAYANGWAAKWYKSKGGGWKKKSKK